MRAPTDARLTPGSRVDHFKVLRLVGRGGMGEVFLARDTQLGRKVALKMILPEALGDSENATRFLQEARITARFSHPHIVGIHSVGTWEGTPYVALEYVEGQTLRDRLREERLAPREGMRVGLAIADALAEAHRHEVLHRDLKPGNVILGKDGRLRVLDFGLAKLTRGEARDAPGADPEEVTVLSEGRQSAQEVALGGAQAAFESGEVGLRGTPAYMSPEQWREEPATAASDVWALGTILYELAAGRRPFHTAGFHQLCVLAAETDPMPSVGEAAAGLPEALVTLIDQCLARRGEERPRANEVRARLATLLQGRGDAPADPEVPPYRGLLPFAERHANAFFGRDEETAAFVERLREVPVLPVVGPSGAGKSSFVQAGVIPRLREQGRWVILRVRPGRRPLLELAQRLVAGEALSYTASGVSGPRSRTAASSLSLNTSGLAERWAEGERLAAELVESPARLALALTELAASEEARVLLVVDQLEELAALTDEAETRRTYLRAVTGAADDPEGPVRVVLTLRDDFLGRLTEIPEAQAALAQVVVLRPPGPEALREILERPAADRGYTYGDGLAADMVASVEGSPAALPLLQFTAHMLWERRDESARRLTREAYTTLGGVAGALARHAGQVLAGLSAEEERLAGRILVRLVTTAGTRQILPRTELLDGLGEPGKRVLERLTATRTVLARKGRGGAVTDYKLVHESLITCWDRLGAWLEESREERGFLAEVGEAAALWQRRGCPESEVWTGPALHDAQARAARCETVPSQSQRFLEAGAAREGRRRRARRLGYAAIVAVMAVVAAGSLAAALVIGGKSRELSRKSHQVRQERDRAQTLRGVALLSGAQAAFFSGDRLLARARLRSALEVGDSSSARALWRRLGEGPLRWKQRLGSWLYAVAFSHDGRRVAAGAGDNAIYLIDAATREVRVLRGHTDHVLSVAFSPDGRWLASGTWGGVVGLWDLTTGKLRRLRGHKGGVRGVAFNPEGNRLASASADKTVRLWALPGGQSRAVLTGHTQSVVGVSFSAQGDLLASASSDKTVRLWSLPGGAPRAVLKGHSQSVIGASFSAQGDLLASASSDKTVRLWSLPTGKLQAVLRGHTQGVKGVSFSARGDLLASASSDKTVRLWSLPSGRLRAVLRGHTQSVRSVSFGPRGQRLASASYDKTVRLWSLPKERPRVVLGGHTQSVHGVSFSPRGDLLASASDDKTVRLWSLPEGRPRAVLRGHAQSVWAVSFSPRGDLLASAGDDKMIRLWAVDQGRSRPLGVLKGHTQSVQTLRFSPRGDLLASGSDDKTIRLWALPGGAPRAVLKGHTHNVSSVSFSPAGDLLASGSSDKTVRLWALPGGAPRAVLKGHTQRVWGAGFNPRGNLLASASDDRTVRLWEVATGRAYAPRPLFGPHTHRAYWLSWHPKGRRLGVPLADGSAWIWDIQTGTRVVLRGHRGEVNYLRFSPDGRYAATGSDDGTVRLWHAHSGWPYWRAPLLRPASLELLSHQGWQRLGSGDRILPGPRVRWRQAVSTLARVAAESAGGELLCLGTHRGTLQLWDPRSDKLLRSQKLAGEPANWRLEATPEGCLSLAGGVARWHPKSGAAKILRKKITAALSTADGIWLAGDGQATQHHVATGAVQARYKISPGAAALGRVGPVLVVGYAEGNLELVRVAGPATHKRPSFTFEGVPSSPPVRIIPGPRSTVIVGYANGLLGIWSLRNGHALQLQRLHGPVIHLILKGQKLYAASELGSHLVWDLRHYYMPYCQLLRSVWRDIPIVLDQGIPVRRRPDPRHRCHR